MDENVLEIKDLEVTFSTRQGEAKVVRQVSFCLPRGKTVALVGESGCGKSVTGLSVMGLLEKPQGRITGGQIWLSTSTGPVNLAAASDRQMQKLRGRELGMIFQEPMSALNPVLTIGKQLSEVVLCHGEQDRVKAKAASLEMLRAVGIAQPERVYTSYPHQLSGGMRQRIVIAMALISGPRVVIADEPTTALDVTVQAQILGLLQDLIEKSHSALLLVTHDLSVVAQMAQAVVVMYAGKVVEEGPVEAIFANAAHPYTLGLMASKPVVGQGKGKLYAIGGAVPNPLEMPLGCPFHTRCPRATEICREKFPKETLWGENHRVFCHHPGKERDHGERTAAAGREA